MGAEGFRSMGALFSPVGVGVGDRAMDDHRCMNDSVFPTWFVRFFPFLNIPLRV